MAACRWNAGQCQHRALEDSSYCETHAAVVSEQVFGDGKKIKADTFYSLKGGKFVEAA